MQNRNLIASCLAGLFLSSLTSAFAADQEQTKNQAQDQVQQQIKTQDQDRARVQEQDRNRERIYGGQLMTPQEHTEYQNKMRSMKTQQERDAYRLQHHKQMQERARERGQELPDNPPAKGGGMGPGGGEHRGR